MDKNISKFAQHMQGDVRNQSRGEEDKKSSKNIITECSPTYDGKNEWSDKQSYIF